METMAKLWLADTTSSPLLLLLLSFASVSTVCFRFPAAFEMMKTLAGFILTDFRVVLFLQERRQWLFLCFSLLFSVYIFCFVFVLVLPLFFDLVFDPPALIFGRPFIEIKLLAPPPVLPLQDCYSIHE
jgi:hypothetical protein